MSEKFLFLLEDFSAAQTAQIGSHAKSISKLKAASISVPKAVSIPKNTLKIIAHANNVSAKVFKIIENTNLQSAISKNKSASQLNHLIRRQHIPNELAKVLLKTYHDYFKLSYVEVCNADEIRPQNFCISNIKGDTNFTDSVLELWAKAVEIKFRQMNSRSERTHDLVFPTQILVKQQIEADVSGVAYTFDTRDGNKSRITIKSCYGIYDKNKSSDTDLFITDLRTHNCIKRKISHQTEQLSRDNEQLKLVHTKKNNQQTETLTEKQIKELTKIATKIKRMSLEQYEILWGLKDNHFYIEDIKKTAVRSSKKENSKTNTKVKIYASIKDSNTLSRICKQLDGIAILNSGQLLTMLGEHPIHVSKSSKKKHLTSAIAKTINKYLAANKDLTLFYRSQNLTSLELYKLKFATNYEVKEANPSLGFRGAARIIGQPNLFELELQILKEILDKTDKKVSFVIPFVRQPGEVTQVLKLIEKSGLTHNPNFKVWLELSTPENILNISAYPLKNISGLIFNTKNIHSLLLGIDPKNSDIYSRYSKDSILIKTLLHSLISIIKSNTRTQSIHHKPKIVVDLTDFDKQLLEQLLEEEIDGIIVNPEVTALTKECIINTESVLLS